MPRGGSQGDRERLGGSVSRCLSEPGSNRPERLRGEQGQFVELNPPPQGPSALPGMLGARGLARTLGTPSSAGGIPTGTQPARPTQRGVPRAGTRWGHGADSGAVPGAGRLRTEPEPLGRCWQEPEALGEGWAPALLPGTGAASKSQARGHGTGARAQPRPRGRAAGGFGSLSAAPRPWGWAPWGAQGVGASPP